MIMKRDYTVRAQHFLEQLWPYICDCGNDYWKYYNAIQAYNYHKSRRVYVCHGASRISIITSDYVIKFDYNEGQAKFTGGCMEEVKFYQFAKEEGYSHLLAPATPFLFHDRFFIIMPRIYNVGSSNDYIHFYLNDDDRDFVGAYLYDMHEENFGWKDGYPVIVDYACNFFLNEKKVSEG